MKEHLLHRIDRVQLKEGQGDSGELFCKTQWKCFPTAYRRSPTILKLNGIGVLFLIWVEHHGRRVTTCFLVAIV